MYNKQITKIIVYYADGTFEEIVKNPVTYPVNDPVESTRCLACGGYHGSTNLPCPKWNPSSAYTINATVSPEDLKAWEDTWKEAFKKYEPGQEDPGK